MLSKVYLQELAPGKCDALSHNTRMSLKGTVEGCISKGVCVCEILKVGYSSDSYQNH